MSFSRMVAVCLLAVGLAACSTSRVRHEPEQRPVRDSITHFSLEGRMAITRQGSSNTVRISWEHTTESDTVGFSGPLGNRLAELQRDATGARWLTSEGEVYEAGNANELVERLTRLSVPLESLSRWVLGQTGEQAEVERDSNGRLLSALEDGWAIRVDRYESEAPDALPALVQVEGYGLRVKLAIEDWQL